MAAPCRKRVDPRMGGDPGPPRGISLRAAHSVIPKEFSLKTRWAGEKLCCFCFLLSSPWFGLGFFVYFFNSNYARFPTIFAGPALHEATVGRLRTLLALLPSLFFSRRSCTVARGDAAFCSHGIFGLTAVRSSSPLGTRVSLVPVGTLLRCKSLGRRDRSPAENELCRAWQGWSLSLK